MIRKARRALISITPGETGGGGAPTKPGTRRVQYPGMVVTMTGISPPLPVCRRPIQAFSCTFYYEEGRFVNRPNTLYCLSTISEYIKSPLEKVFASHSSPRYAYNRVSVRRADIGSSRFLLSWVKYISTVSLNIPAESIFIGKSPPTPSPYVLTVTRSAFVLPLTTKNTWPNIMVRVFTAFANQ